MSKTKNTSKTKRAKQSSEFDASGKLLVNQAIKVIKPICAGLDVHKDIVVATICEFKNRKSMIPNFYQDSFSTFNCDLVDLSNWIKEHGCTEVYMESTGKYSTPIYNVLEKEGLNPHIVNPKYTRSIKGRKNDKKDSKWIAELACYDLLVDSYIPESEIRELRDLSRRRIRLSQDAADEKRRIQNIMTVSNLKLDAVFSKGLCKSSIQILELLIEKGDQATDEEILALVHPKVKKKELIPKAVDGRMLTGNTMDLLTSALDHLEYLTLAEEDLIEKMANICQKYEVYVSLLKTIPGISDVSAMSIIAETGVDMSQFLDKDHFISWCGLSPASNSSAGKNKSTRIGKGGKYLKPILVQCAASAVYRSKDPYFSGKFNSIKARRGANKALIAIARKMMVSAYYMFQTGEVFQPKDYKETTRPKEEKLTLRYQTEAGQTVYEAKAKASLDLLEENLPDLGSEEDKKIQDLLKQIRETMAQKFQPTSHKDP